MLHHHCADAALQICEAPLRVLHKGFDKLDIAYCGGLSADDLASLRIAKTVAQEHQESILAQLGSEEVHVLPGGQQGGYAFVCDTGPLGELWAFKDNSNSRQWNIMVKVRAAALATKDICAIREQLERRLKAFGARITDHSLHRVDYAIDLLIPPHFELRHRHVVAHSRCRIQGHWGDQRQNGDTYRPSCVFRGRRVESITIGKLPNAQVCLYDKRSEVITKQKPWWFEVWGIDRHDPTAGVLRVEMRAMKSLKARKPKIDINDLETALGPVFQQMADKVRYVDEGQTDSNVSRQQLHPLWSTVQTTLKSSTLSSEATITPEGLCMIERWTIRDRYLAHFLGHLGGYAVTCDLDDHGIEGNLPEIARYIVAKAVKPGSSFWDSVKRTREKLTFVVPPRGNKGNKLEH